MQPFFCFWLYKRLLRLTRRRPRHRNGRNNRDMNMTEVEGEVDEVGTRDRDEVRIEFESHVRAEEGRHRMRVGKLMENYQNIPLVTLKDDSMKLQPLNEVDKSKPRLLRLTTVS